jgi:hypothetical protein
VVGLDRQRHFDLVKLALDNPEFFAVVDGDLARGGDLRLRTYANLMMGYWVAMWELGELGESELRALTCGMFANDAARTWWGQVHGRWITVPSRRRRRFITIVDEEWSKAEAVARTAVPRIVAEPEHATELRRRGRFAAATWGVAVVCGMVGAAAGAGLARRRGSAARRSVERS